MARAQTISVNAPAVASLEGFRDTTGFYSLSKGRKARVNCFRMLPSGKLFSSIPKDSGRSAGTTAVPKIQSKIERE